MARGKIEAKIYIVKNKETGLNTIYKASTVASVKGIELKAFISAKNEELKKLKKFAEDNFTFTSLTQAQAGACGMNVDAAIDLTKEDESPAE